MNSYSLEEIYVGMEASFEITVSQQELLLFKQITGDENPLHTDTEYANKAGYNGRIAYGMLTASYLSTLAGMYLPGEKSIIHGVEIKFPNPLVMDKEQKLSVKGIVSKIDERFHVFTLKVEITANDGVKVCRGKMHIGVR